MEDKRFIKRALMVLVAGLLFLFLAVWAVPRALVLLTQAAPGSEFAIANSYLFGSPLLARADGEEKIRINAFLLDDKGRGVADRRVEVLVRPEAGGVNAQLREVQSVTDEMGKSVWEVFSGEAGKFTVSAQVEGISFPQEVTVVFR